MGYRDDFYVAENLIGYSGQLHKMPTVYFKNGNSFGHITQYHEIPQNTGREPVDSDPNYQIGNEMINGVLKLVERTGPTPKDIFHESRSCLTSAVGLDADSKAILMQSLWKCPEKKEISSMNRKARNTIFDQSDRKQALLDQIRK